MRLSNAFIPCVLLLVISGCSSFSESESNDSQSSLQAMLSPLLSESASADASDTKIQWTTQTASRSLLSVEVPNGWDFQGGSANPTMNRLSGVGVANADESISINWTENERREATLNPGWSRVGTGAVGRDDYEAIVITHSAPVGSRMTTVSCALYEANSIPRTVCVTLRGDLLSTDSSEIDVIARILNTFEHGL